MTSCKNKTYIGDYKETAIPTSVPSEEKNKEAKWFKKLDWNLKPKTHFFNAHLAALYKENYKRNRLECGKADSFLFCISVT